ncbi:thyroid stimulating hormone subunit beta a [Conger conger]|uniref:thyroid stimulating hormone subunit beta a n=1 Tax=Conger conger TaxID=82655 RepID=UPI002A5A886F|nr:thyroid stimulating hormone subunit beta a [Conger conger]
MSVVLLTGGLLCLFVGQALSICSPVDYTLHVEKPECDFCVAVNTTICMGFCVTRVPNIRLAMRRLVEQKGCMYDAVEYRTARLPGCPPHVDPQFSYPVALRCICRECDSARDECTHRASANGDSCSKPLRHIHAYPGQSHYLQPL